jgi:hypothetical protein
MFKVDVDLLVEYSEQEKKLIDAGKPDEAAKLTDKILKQVNLGNATAEVIGWRFDDKPLYYKGEDITYKLMLL